LVMVSHSLYIITVSSSFTVKDMDI
jgi:hypothetical protein